jgi:hypothetical protein
VWQKKTAGKKKKRAQPGGDDFKHILKLFVLGDIWKPNGV